MPQVIGGELQDRLIPVPYSKNTTDQAVSPDLLLNLVSPWIASCTESALQMVRTKHGLISNESGELIQSD